MLVYLHHQTADLSKLRSNIEYPAAILNTQSTQPKVIFSIAIELDKHHRSKHRDPTLKIRSSQVITIDFYLRLGNITDAIAFTEIDRLRNQLKPFLCLNLNR